MSKRGQMFSCLTTAIAGFVLLCPALAGRAFGDFQLVVDFKIGAVPIRRAARVISITKPPLSQPNQHWT